MVVASNGDGFAAAFILVGLVVYALIGPIPGIWAATILSKKGHGFGRGLIHVAFGFIGPAVLFFSVGQVSGIGGIVVAFLPCFIVLLSAAIAEDRAKEQQVAVQFRKLHAQARNAHEQASISGQVRCPRCGSMNAAELIACWHCGLELVVEENPVKLLTLARKPLPVRAKPADDHEAIRAKLDEKLRIECKTCGKQMQGQKMKVQSLRRCPKCGATPFDYKQLPKA